MKRELVQADIEATLLKLKEHTKAVGDYVRHEVTGDGDYLVTLTNGRIMLYHAEILDAHNLQAYRLPDMAVRFRESKSTTV